MTAICVRFMAALHSLIQWDFLRLEVNPAFFRRNDSSQVGSCLMASFCMLPGFVKSDGMPCPVGVLRFYFMIWSLNFICIRCFVHSMFHATPVGQASNPGPDTCGIRLAICNPTAVHKKVDVLMNFQAQIVAASETSATNIIQKQVTNDFRNKGFRSFWSPPVAPKKMTVDNRPSFRGEAVGSAVFTSLPCRELRCEIPLALKESQRFSSCIVRFAGIEVLIISLYGFANRYREGKRPNDLLLASLVPVITEVGLPFIICGDFNEPVEKLPSYKFFKDMGAIEAFRWYHAKHGVMLPPTCGGSTRNDTAIFHPLIADRILDMSVQPEFQIDVHTPLFVQLDVEQSFNHVTTWRLPKTWAPFAPSRENIAQFYEHIDFDNFFHQKKELSSVDLEQAFLHWSRRVEQAVDRAVAFEHRIDPVRQPRSCLHSSYKGRCSFKSVLQNQHRPVIRSDRHGGYMPPCEILTLRCRLKIRQVRRLKSLCRRYKALPLDSEGSPLQNQCLRDAYSEWKCILNAKGYGNCWSNWIMAFELVPALSLWLPTFEVLDLVTQITQHDCDHSCRDESRKRALCYKAKIHIDNHDDYGRMSYKIIQAKESSPLSEVPVQKTTHVRLLRSRHGHTALLMDDDIDVPSICKLKLEEAEIDFIGQEGRKIFFKHVSDRLPSSGVLTISFVAVTAHEIGDEFSRFWSTMWKRDPRDDQFSESGWRQFENILEETPLPKIPQIAYPFMCVDTWMKLVASLPSGKATGPCGWSNDELKLLPRICIADLCWIFHRVADVGFSSNMMMAKTVLLAKVPIPQSMNHARPITILSCLYRLFGKFVFRHTAGVWRHYLPFPISGGLPGRGVKELAFAQKRCIEDAVLKGECIGGFSLDLIKAYNTFGRYAVSRIMLKLGVPICLLDAWIASLDVMERFPQINGVVTKSISSTTGVPEGCSISVLSMLATSSLYYFRLAQPNVMPFAYADNWSWMSRQQRAHFETFSKMQALVQSMRLQVDYQKSWHWGTTKAFRDSCDEFQSRQDNPGETVQILSCVKDLGELVHYNKSASIGFIRDKIDEGIRRIQRIEWLPCDLQRKALFIQTSVWPYMLYSCDTTYIGQRHFEKIRRAVVNTLVGHWHAASPMLACNFLSKFLVDPFFYTICLCARVLRRLASVQ